MDSVSHRICSVERSHIADLIQIGEAANLSPWSAQSYVEEMKNPNSIMLRLVTDENETIGFVVGRLVAGGEIDVRTDAEIYNIAVKEALQGRGAGQKLLNAFVGRVSDAGAQKVWLEVRESNRKAIDFYKKNGFEAVQTRPHFYTNPRENAILMSLRLRQRKG
ncbi:MAG: ribosomal protein S18-alanine N-acetyltransferase [Acidobacteria bacterium]|nr:ribosomal protein S18-alanine N-acetyltransferase [Acidobacteriota bacterium]